MSRLPGYTPTVFGFMVKNSVLTEAKVAEIRALRLQGATLKALADKYGVSRETIRQATSGKTWKHVEAPTVEVMESSMYQVGEFLTTKNIIEVGTTHFGKKVHIDPGMVGRIKSVTRRGNKYQYTLDFCIMGLRNPAQRWLKDVEEVFTWTVQLSGSEVRLPGNTLSPNGELQLEEQYSDGQNSDFSGMWFSGRLNHGSLRYYFVLEVSGSQSGLACDDGDKGMLFNLTLVAPTYVNRNRLAEVKAEAGLTGNDHNLRQSIKACHMAGVRVPIEEVVAHAENEEEIIAAFEKIYTRMEDAKRYLDVELNKSYNSYGQTGWNFLKGYQIPGR
jgi:hypothetical protein